jgi:hypothetical protein
MAPPREASLLRAAEAGDAAAASAALISGAAVECTDHCALSRELEPQPA